MFDLYKAVVATVICVDYGLALISKRSARTSMTTQEIVVVVFFFL